jgi:4-amino-4-deoxy-L-arabinose transferase-like glycosyltransferase
VDEIRASRGRGTSVVHWLNRNERGALLLLLTIAVILRGVLIAFAPTPFGYVWDFYYEGVRHLARTGHLPTAADCWQCYHPPVFYLLGWPAYALGRWMGSDAAGTDVTGLRWLAGLATLSAGVTIGYGYRLLRLFGCRGASLVMGFALLVTFPCLFISSYGAEADIVLTAVLSAFLYYLSRDFVAAPSAVAALRLGTFAGIAAATKYSGLVALVSGCLVFGLRAIAVDCRMSVLRHAALMIVTCCVVGGWKYVENYRQYGTPLYANGSAARGFTIAGRPSFRDQYEFTTLRIAELMRLVSRRAAKGALTDLPVYRSVPTTLHALAWSDMTFFSEPTRHGDPSHPYPRKRLAVTLTRAVLVLGFVPELLATVGFAVTIRRRIFWPVAVMCLVSAGAYEWWFISQQQWGLKTKYLLFLLPAFVIYAVTGLAWVWRRARLLGIAAGTLLACLVVLAHFYLLAFALG